MESQPLFYAFLLTILAGLATGIGSCLAFFARRTNTKFLSFSLGFSAGVMIYVSFVEIFPESGRALAQELGDFAGHLWASIYFFAGILIAALLDKILPEARNPHEFKKVEQMERRPLRPELYRMGIFSALAIAVHNFPEGLVTFVAALSDPNLGLAIAVAIAIHNIPEGIAVAVPIYYSTGSRRKAFLLSFASGLAEPLGALLGYLVLAPFISSYSLGCLFALVAGLMIYISFDELLPASEKYGAHHLSIYGLILGMFVMALSLVLL